MSQLSVQEALAGAARTGAIAGVVLAAGLSRRMGRNKLLLDLDGESVVRRTVRTALQAGLDPVLVVLGHEGHAIRAALAPLGCAFVVNDGYAAGMNSSVCAGIAALPPDAVGALVLLADMPFVSAAMIRTLVATFRTTDALMIVSEYAGVHAPPILYDQSLFAELAGAEGRGCGKRMRRRHPERACVVAWPAEALADLDRPEDYERVKAELRTHPFDRTS